MGSLSEDSASCTSVSVGQRPSTSPTYSAASKEEAVLLKAFICATFLQQSYNSGGAATALRPVNVPRTHDKQGSQLYTCHAIDEAVLSNYVLFQQVQNPLGTHVCHPADMAIIPSSPCKNELAPHSATLVGGSISHCHVLAPEMCCLYAVAARAAKACRLGSLDLGRDFSLHNGLIHLHSNRKSLSIEHRIAGILPSLYLP